eukprot:TRINITY_DN27568_c0_g1_i1.p1 TRINITY_DN27568_c0_g1~~TRINITY_DN27568_c0_g1_i1.p1  ORF type:complete len:390 (-),score=38.75 TRINITY_DN27568_c0_g1_i1:236-1405(-)
MAISTSILARSTLPHVTGLKILHRSNNFASLSRRVRTVAPHISATSSPPTSRAPSVTTIGLRSPKPSVAEELEADNTPSQGESQGASQGEALHLACPICHEPLIQTAAWGLDHPEYAPGRLRCGRCRRAFPTELGIADLTVTGESGDYEERQQAGTTIFQSPLVAFAYERGWRAGFAAAGFPGPEEEFKIAQRYFKQGGAFGQPLLDISCGSGLFSRLFLTSGDYPLVVAGDYSRSMLLQCRDFLRQQVRRIDPAKIALVRADVSRLPFATGSLGGVHAGAAIHCWDKPTLAVAEISRVLAPGGVFVASTFCSTPPPPLFPEAVWKSLEQAALQSQVEPYRWWRESELRALTEACGLVDFKCVTRQRFILFTARKPVLEDQGAGPSIEH